MDTRIFKNRCLALLFVAILPMSGNLAVAGDGSNECDRECLYGFVDAYLDALVARDPGRLPVSPDVKFTENDLSLNLGEGTWETATGIGSYQLYAADVKTGQVGFMGVVQRQGLLASMLALRLKIIDSQIMEIETIVPGETIASSNLSGFMAAPATLVTARPGFRVALTLEQSVPRDVLLAAADSYYTGIEEGSGDIVAFSDECHRMENGIPLVNNPDYDWPMVPPEGKKLPDFAAMGCREQFNTRIWTTDSISDRRYPLIDEERGIVFAFTIYHQFSKKQCADIVDVGLVCPAAHVEPFSLALAEAFKLRNGQIYEMESIWSILPDNRQNGEWTDSR